MTAPTASPDSLQPCRSADGCAGLCSEAGLTAAYHAHRARLQAHARFLLNDVGLAEEAVQEAFLRAWQACWSFAPDGPPLYNWLLVITRNVCIDLARARARRPRILAATAGEDLPEPDTEDGLADRLVQQATLRQALARVSADHRRVVVAAIVHGRPHADVAAELGVPIGTVRSRLHYALRRMRELIDAADLADAA